MGPFLLCWVYRRESSSRIVPVIAEGRAKRLNGRIYLVPLWSRLPSAEQVKLHLPLAEASSLMPLRLQASRSVLELNSLTLAVLCSLAFPFQHMYCHQKASRRREVASPSLRAERWCLHTQEKASLQKLSVSAPSSTSVALLLTTAVSCKHFVPVPIKRKK